MNDKVVVIVGASGGIGSRLGQLLGAAGARLVLAGRNTEKLMHLQSSLPPGAVVVPTDIRYPEQTQSLMERAIVEFGQVDILVNAAGAGVMKQFNKIEPADLDHMLEVNLKGSFFAAQAAINVMKERKVGHICNVIGILGKHPMAMASAYCAAKFGVVGWSKCMADEVRRFGIRVTLFYFGGVDTPFWDGVSLKVDRSKMLTPETAAQAIMFALSAEPQAVPLEINIQPESHMFL
jgi:NADP-dependent 3-hydroxy acid dehydrogenase YdfG